MTILFSEDEMADFLLLRGYIIYVRGEEYEVNTYQNRFVTEYRAIVEVIKDNKIQPIKTAFEKEFKEKLLRNE